MDQQISPVPTKKQTVQVQLAFPEAMSYVIDGKKITRLEWEDSNTYGVLQDGFLMIFTNKEPHKWLVSDGDMLATDWVVLSENN